MAKKISQYPAKTLDFIYTDLFEVSKDIAGTPTTQSFTWADLLVGIFGKRLIANIMQSGTSAPVFKDSAGNTGFLFNSLGEVPTISRNAAGKYYIEVVAPLFDKYKVHFSGSSIGGSVGTLGWTIIDITTGGVIGYLSLYNANINTRLVLECRDITGTLVDISTLVTSNPISLPEIIVF